MICAYTSDRNKMIYSSLLYKSDLLMIGNLKRLISQLKGEFKSRSEKKYLGPATVVLRIQIKRDRANKKLTISQSEYVEYIFTRFRMEQSKPLSTPMDKSCIVEFENAADALDIDAPYRQIICCFI